jgi:hypothetical protein
MGLQGAENLVKKLREYLAKPQTPTATTPTTPTTVSAQPKEGIPEPPKNWSHKGEYRVWEKNFDTTLTRMEEAKHPKKATVAKLIERARQAAAERKFEAAWDLAREVEEYRDDVKKVWDKWDENRQAADKKKEEEQRDQRKKELLAYGTTPAETEKVIETSLAELGKKYQEVLKQSQDPSSTSSGNTTQLTDILKPFTQVFSDVCSGMLNMGNDEQAEVKKNLLQKVFGNEACLKAIATDGKLCASMLAETVTVKDVPVDTKKLKEALGDSEHQVAAQVLIKTSGADATNTAVEDWMWKAVKKEDWADKSLGLSAQVFNSLWNAGKFDKIATLLDKDQPCDPSQPHSMGCNMGRGLKGVEGIWSGYVQPLEHLLGNYVKKVGGLKDSPLHKELETLTSTSQKFKQELEEAKALAAKAGESGADGGKAQAAADAKQKEYDEAEKARAKKEGEIKKLEGAQKVLAALDKSGKASVLIDYGEIKGSGMIKEFTKKPGTIWGFEDVRMPYVQAAREGEHGQQPLRMWEMWEAIDPALTEGGYDDLLEDPDEAIPRFIALGVEKIKKGMQEKDNHEYDGRDEKEFIKRFEEQATSYLSHLSKQPPKGEFRGVADPSGVDAGKLMGALGCKAGLWWAANKKDPEEPVYYCLDGIKMEDATSYKKLKNANIQAKLSDPSKPNHLEVITFAEIREILKNWDQLKGTVKFYEQGELLAPEVQEKRVEEWIAKMRGHNKDTGKRPAPKAEKYKAVLEKLDPQIFDKLDDPLERNEDGRDADRNALRIVRASANLKRAAKAKHREVLIGYLKSKQCRALIEWGFVPVGLTDLADVVEEARKNARDDAKDWLQKLKTALGLVNDEFKDAVSKKLLEPFENG